MDFFLGLDAGGTKTFCLVGDAEGTIRGFGKAGTGNYEVYGVEHAAVENRRAVEAALDDAGLELTDIRGIGMGIAGADLPEDYDMLEKQIYTPLFGKVPRTFRNDSMGGLRGGTRQPFGIVIACGTGCVCAGRNSKGDEGRVGGLGGEFGDECSGTDLGREGLQKVWQARDGIIPPTRMAALFVEKGGCADVQDLFYKLYRREVTEADLQPMAKIVFDAAFEGDDAACDILEKGGRYLGKMVAGMARQLDMTQDAFEVVTAGSVFKGSSPVLADAMGTVIHRTCPLATTVKPVFEPVVGALLMAIEREFTISDECYDQLSQSLLEAEKKYGVNFKAD